LYEAAKQDAPVEATGPTTKMTLREALRDAMAEEMRADDRVFVMGEEVAEYQGAYKVTQGLLEEFGARRVIDTPITEYGFAGVGTGAAKTGSSRLPNRVERGRPPRGAPRPIRAGRADHRPTFSGSG
jgi:pyruvate dehydrogenase E1 component beta subunit